ncbi:B-box type zinc finger protein ncl-1-like isoform X1 [Episyrphus balteatus]|uniref:B-box type zinc finger protein ncl-1-like isoform X1 n=1 Tax=Episyrphus balteatus TaxID=286459 RepID=UPI0024856413|nr:B-box type zinc finger protein ncl-1-like isoform X1 [Episyrphus balteatus]XP_055844070.1 B-box type zinc finger protein ncl-1-like isoform X1 [Episyrphus balteatus]XP_055844071.1 B-box type zinc finger protein ncl-1-like isoform X1 [Episyrphus balteatus]
MASTDEISNGIFGTFDNNKIVETETAAQLLDEAVDNLTLQTATAMFSEVFESNSKGDELESSPLEDACAFPDGMEKNCKICSLRLVSPRVLSCLHVFCEGCLAKMLLDENGSGDPPLKNSIECPTCKQITPVGPKGVESLTCDYILTNILDLSSIESEMLSCTSCKSKEKAISRCNDCANFLCGGCDNAHKYMRCFENHEVVKLEDLQKTAEKLTIHKPLFCNVHTSENLKYYCYNCQIPVCNDCLIADHKGSEHHYEVIGLAEKCVRVDIEDLMKEAKSKVQYCDSAASKLSSDLTELQSQHDTARDLIEESFQSFKAVLEKCRDQSLKELGKLHSERELKIMDLLQNIENTMGKIDGVCTFTKRVLEQANAAEFLSMKKLISKQFINLINNTPKCDVNYSLEFDTKFDKFEQLAHDTFGKFRTESTPPSPKESTPPPTLPGMPPSLMTRNIMANSSQNALASSVTASSPISLPTSMQSSFDGDLSVLGNGFMMPSVLSPDSPPQHSMGGGGPLSSNGNVGPPPVVGVGNGGPPQPSISMLEYNLQRLANLAENTPDGLSDAMVAAGNPSQGQQTQSITLADILSGDQRAFNNLQALAKLGLNGNVDFHTDMTSNQLLPSGPSPGIDCLLPDFCLPPATSPSLSTLAPLSDEMSITNFHAGINVTGRNKATPMQIRSKFGSLGTAKGQFNSPHGFCLGVDEEIIVADTNNHRIEVFEKNGQLKFHFGVPGKDEGQLWYPRKVAVMHTNGKFVVCDRGNERSRMQIFSKCGHFMRKIAIRYIDIVAGLAVTSKGHIVAVDSVSPTVFVISEEGELVRWFDCSDYMREPSDIAIRDNDFYVCDFKGHCVAVFKEDGVFQYRIGNEKVTCFPNGIDISNAGDILIGDSHGNRFHVACYSRDGVLQSEFECPHVKVSRCCGLKITSEGYVVTLAKNNHHVLVLNTLYVH